MPYASKAQERFFHTQSAAKAGITPQQVAEYDKASKGMKLPEKSQKFGRVKKMLSKKPS
jgi:hypothetical protein